MATVKTKRVYEPRSASDGTRILVMRLWPRGVRRGHVDEWNPDVAPTRELLFDFKHHGLPWSGFVRRFRQELRPEALEALGRRKGTITLLCGCADETRCHRGLLREWLKGRRGRVRGRR